uniref:Ubiquitin-like domain-containing protein n=1 Tax=Aegilops tauschii subsp. strangulata TaxID=200361 RepID=A0A453AXF7_AEGTS
PRCPRFPATQRSTGLAPPRLRRPRSPRRLRPDPPPLSRRQLKRGSDRLASMYIRVKRNKTTYFIQCDPTETILNIKQKLQSITDHPPNNQRLILLATNNILDDSKTLADQKVENDAVVALALRKGSVLVSLGLMFDTYALNV